MKKIPYSGKERVETGAVKFGDDWPGLFIRGDDAFYLEQILNQAARKARLSPFELDFLNLLMNIIQDDVRC